VIDELHLNSLCYLHWSSGLIAMSGVVKLMLTTCAVQTAPDFCHSYCGNYSGSW
jgi:hypothetical protein